MAQRLSDGAGDDGKCAALFGDRFPVRWDDFPGRRDRLNQNLAAQDSDSIRERNSGTSKKYFAWQLGSCSIQMTKNAVREFAAGRDSDLIRRRKVLRGENLSRANLLQIYPIAAQIFRKDFFTSSATRANKRVFTH